MLDVTSGNVQRIQKQLRLHRPELREWGARHALAILELLDAQPGRRQHEIYREVAAHLGKPERGVERHLDLLCRLQVVARERIDARADGYRLTLLGTGILERHRALTPRQPAR